MTNPVESLTQQLIQRATDPFGLTILTGVASSSFFVFGNLALALDGVFPATVNESERAKKDVSETSALKLFEWMFNRAKVCFFPLFCLGSHPFATHILLLMACLAETLRYIRGIERYILFGGFGLPP